MEADGGPVGGQLASLEGPARIVADPERRSVRAQQLVDLRDKPALVPEFEAVAARRQLRQGIREPLVVAVEVARQLPEHRPGLRRAASRLDPPVEPPEPAAESRQPLQWVELA